LRIKLGTGTKGAVIASGKAMINKWLINDWALKGSNKLTAAASTAAATIVNVIM